MSTSRFYDLFEKFKRFYPPMPINGFCHGSSYMAMLALLSSDLTSFIHRLENIYFGFPHPTDQDKRIQLSDLKELARLEDLNLDAEKEEPIEQKAQKTATSHVTQKELSEALSKLISDIKAEDFHPPTSPKTLATLQDAGQSMETTRADVKAISAEQLLEQYKYAVKIRSAYTKKIRKQIQDKSTELSVRELRQRVAIEMEKFDSKYPYILGLINLTTYFTNISFFQKPEEYRYLYSEDYTTINHHNLEDLLPLLSPVNLDRKVEGGVQKIDDICHLYSIADLQSTLQSLADIIDSQRKMVTEDDNFPLALIVSSHHHSITLGYKDKKWILINPNDSFPRMIDVADIGLEIVKSVLVLPDVLHHGTKTTVRMKYNEHKKQLILYDAIQRETSNGKEQVALALLHTDKLPKFTDLKINISLRVYSRTQSKKSMHQIVSTLRESKEFREAHKITDENLKLREDIFNATLLSFACKIENRLRATELIAQGVATKHFVPSDSTQTPQVQAAMARLYPLLKRLTDDKNLAKPTKDEGTELLLGIVKLGLYKIAKTLVIPQAEYSHLLKHITESFCKLLNDPYLNSMDLIRKTLKDSVSYADESKFNAAIKEGTLLLIAAIKHNRDDVVRLLRETGVDGYEALILAIKYADEVTGLKLLNLEIQNLSKPQKSKLLEQAISRYNINEVMKTLLLSDLSLAEPFILCRLAKYSQHIDVLKMLHDQKIDLDQPDSVTHKTPLMVATESWHCGVSTLPFLLEAKANIHYTLPDGDTALHLAVRYQDRDNVKTLLTLKANPNASNKKLETPLSLAPAAFIHGVDITKILLDHGAKSDLIRSEKIEDSKLYQSFNYPDQKKALEEYRAQYLISEKLTFHNALRDNDVVTMQSFVKEKGANLSLPGRESMWVSQSSPLLYHAVIFSDPPRPDIVEVLLKNGADPNYNHAILWDFLNHALKVYKNNETEKFADILQIANLLVHHKVKIYSFDLFDFERELVGLHQKTISRLFYSVFNLNANVPFLNKLIKLFYDPKIHRASSSDLLKPIFFIPTKTIENTPAEEFVYAIIRGDAKKAKELLEDKQVEINSLISDGKTQRSPLHHALSPKVVNADMVELLLQYGAKPTSSTLTCLFQKVQTIIDIDNKQQQDELIKIAKLLRAQGVKPTKADLQYLDNVLQKSKFSEKNYYIRGANLLADNLIESFNDPSLHEMQYIKLEQSELSLYQEYKKTDCQLRDIDWGSIQPSDVPEWGGMYSKHGFIKCSDVLSANASLEKAISVYNPHALFTEPKKISKERISRNYQYADQLLKNIISKKVAEQKSESRQERLSYLFPG
ncbi:MAG: ankyrin repeat domain-containing protein [Gammaproteobacteria bacterium]